MQLVLPSVLVPPDRAVPSEAGSDTGERQSLAVISDVEFIWECLKNCKGFTLCMCVFKDNV